MLLTSYNRARRFMCVEDTLKNRRSINTFMYAISNNIEAYLDRLFEKVSRTEFFDLAIGQREFFVSAPEISTITTVKVDPTGEFEGSETPITDSYVGSSGNSVVLQFQQIPAKRGLQIVYTGGVSTTSTISTYTLSAVVGSFTVNGFLEGQSSGAFGIIKSFNIISKIMTVEILYGAFTEGEVLFFRAGEDDGISPGISAVLTSIDVKSFVEIFPEIATACEMQISYTIRTQSDFENKTVTKDMVSRRDIKDAKSQYNNLQPEVRSMLNKFRRHVFY